jgi:uncharacterized protein
MHGNRYIYNSLTKSFIQLLSVESLDEIVERLNKYPSSMGEIKNVNELLENGFIVGDNLDEYSMMKYLARKYFFDSSNLNIVLVPSMECNFACPYCFEAPGKTIKTKDGFYDTLKKYAEKNFKFYNNIQISLFGGEPLLEIENMLDFLAFTKKLSSESKFQYSTSIVTNGSLISGHILDQLISHNCKSLQITLDGCKKSHDKYRSFKDGTPSFDKLIEIINTTTSKYIIDNKFEFVLRINLNNNTIEEISETLLQIAEPLRKNVNVLFRPIYSTKKYRKENSNELIDLDQFYTIAKMAGYKIVVNRYMYRSCEACGDENFFYLTPDQKMYKCINNVELKESYIGQINDNGEVTLISEHLTKWHDASDCFSDDQCKSCKLLPDCLGGCISYKVSTGKKLCKIFEMSSLPYYYKENS